MKELTKNDFYFCYNPLLHKYLHDKCKIRYITGALHEKTLNKFWIYAKSEKLNNCIQEYKNIFE